MVRIFVFLVVIVFVAWGLSTLLDFEGTLVLRTESEEFYTPYLGFLFAALLIIAIGLVCLTLFTSWAWRLPSKIRRGREDSRRERGMIALTRGLEAVVAGDAVDAQRHARLANKSLNEPSLTRLLTAQAAQLAGDQETAGTAFASMLEAPETEFLGLRGLYLQAIENGDRNEARGYAERAFELRPGAEWAYQSVYDLSLERGAWGDACQALTLAQQHGLETGDSAKRKEAALLTAGAYAARAAEDTDTALKDAEAALKKSPGFPPAAVLAAELEGLAGRRSRAGRILDEAWAVNPHPALAKTMADLFAEETVERRAARIKRMADRSPEADESKLLMAEQDVELGLHQTARETLEGLLTRAPRARTFRAMAASMEGLFGAEAATVWYDRAAAAPLDPVPGADGVFHFTTDGWRRLITEYSEHGRMAPPPLEEVSLSLSIEEISALIPLPAPEPTPEPEDNTTDQDDAELTAAEGANDAATDESSDENADATGGEDAPKADTSVDATEDAPTASRPLR